MTQLRFLHADKNRGCVLPAVIAGRKLRLYGVWVSVVVVEVAGMAGVDVVVVLVTVAGVEQPVSDSNATSAKPERMIFFIKLFCLVD